MCPHYFKWVPKDPKANRFWRLKVRAACLRSELYRERIWQMCAEDPLFFIGTFCYLVEPRDDEEVTGKIPFVPWEHQEPVIAAMGHTMGRRHVVGKKSRAQGASWIALCLLLHAFLFRDHCFLGMGSKTQQDADDPADPKSLGWKFDFLMKHLPGWMRPPDIEVGGENRMVSRHTWYNPLKENYLKAEAATVGIARGGRYFCFALDEAAFFPIGTDSEAVHNLLETTNSVWLISTPNGTNNEFYLRATNPGVWLTTDLMWWNNPVQKRGLYTTHRGNLQILDKDYEFPENYPFKLDGKKRSPWYDRKCAYHDNNELLIAQELDGSFTGSVGRPFGEDLLARVRNHVRLPIIRGNFSFDPLDLHDSAFVPAGGGELSLWRPVDNRYRLPAANYVLGCDISAGTAGDTSSNSAISIWDGQTCEQVGEWVHNGVPPAEFAELTVALCFWLSSPGWMPFLNWENNGSTGSAFTSRIIELQYPRVYYTESGGSDQFWAKKTKKLGVFNSRVDRVLSPLKNALHTQKITMRSEECVRELSEYVYDGDRWIHPGSKNTRDASSGGLNHGDRAIAAAIAVIALKDQGYLRHETVLETAPEASGPPPNSTAGRFERWKKERKERKLMRSCVW